MSDDQLTPEFKEATSADLEGILNVAQCYLTDFDTYLEHFPRLIEEGKVFAIKLGGAIVGFATYNPLEGESGECVTSSARSPEITRDMVSGDWMRQSLEGELLARGFRVFSAHVRLDNSNARKMLERNGYQPVGVIGGQWVSYQKTIQ